MPCESCYRFPAPTSNFAELGLSSERQGTVYQCKKCGTYLELVAEERSVRFTPLDELRRHYPDVFGDTTEEPAPR
jgi:RNase P subunit RPR2